MFLRYKNIIFKIRRSKVTDYAALKQETSLFVGILVFISSEISCLVKLRMKNSFITLWSGLA